MITYFIIFWISPLLSQAVILTPAPYEFYDSYENSCPSEEHQLNETRRLVNDARDWNWEDMGCKEKSCENSVRILASLYSCYQNTVSDLCLFFDDKDLNRKFVYDLMVPTLHHKCIERGISQNLKDVLQLDVLSVSRNNSIATELDLTSENNEICIDTAYMICYIVYGIASILLTVVSMLVAVFT